MRKVDRPDLALEPDRAADRVEQAPRDVEARAGAAVAGVDVALGLADGGEDQRLRLGRDADAGVLDGQLAGAERRAGGGDDAAAGGELDRVADQVREHHAQLQLIGGDSTRRLRGARDAGYVAGVQAVGANGDER
ncbi:MAG TPA: hypothetical protein VL049_11140 [Candidatus Dormibacteraeota bacterium]|nr:hypothetical protein [Candidatus Dormibacteraeota bacterium]